jgi:hypothetical protein
VELRGQRLSERGQEAKNQTWRVYWTRARPRQSPAGAPSRVARSDRTRCSERRPGRGSPNLPQRTAESGMRDWRRLGDGDQKLEDGSALIININTASRNIQEPPICIGLARRRSELCTIVCESQSRNLGQDPSHTTRDVGRAMGRDISCPRATSRREMARTARAQ